MLWMSTILSIPIARLLLSVDIALAASQAPQTPCSIRVAEWHPRGLHVYNKLMSSSESSRTSSAWNLALSRPSHKSSRACAELALVCNFLSSHHLTFRCPINIHTFCIIGILRLNHRNHTLDTCTIPFYHGIWPPWSHRRHICSRPHDAGSVMSCSRLSSPLSVLLCVYCFLALRCFASGLRAVACFSL
jgi:hypothetical protein